MGLLDMLQNDPEKQNALRQGLLSAGIQMLAGGRQDFGTSLGQGMGAGVDTYSAQMDIMKKKKAKEAMLAGIFPRAPGMPTNVAGSNAEAGAPAAPANPYTPVQPQQPDRMAQARMMVESGIPEYEKIGMGMLTEYQKPRDITYGEVKFTGDGKPYREGNDGSIKWVDGITPRDKLVTDNLGGVQRYRTEYSADPVAEVDRTATPDSVLTDTRARSEGAANRGVTMRGQNLTDARSRESNAQGGKAPAGYRFTTDGGLEAIPGGPADIKAGEAGAKDAARKEFALAQSQNVLDAITDAKKLVGPTTAGFGGTLRNMPMTGARDLDAKITTIKANLGFDRLQQMRDTSPTGGALGQVAVQELTALQATVASLDQLQSPEELKKALGKIETHYTNWQKTLKGEQPNTPAQSFALPPNAKQYEGKTIKDTKTGKRFQAKGGKWTEIK